MSRLSVSPSFTWSCRTLRLLDLSHLNNLFRLFHISFPLSFAPFMVSIWNSAFTLQIILKTLFRSDVKICLSLVVPVFKIALERYLYFSSILFNQGRLLWFFFVKCIKISLTFLMKISELGVIIFHSIRPV